MCRKYEELSTVEKKTRWIMEEVEKRGRDPVMQLIGHLCLVGGAAHYLYDFVFPPKKIRWSLSTMPPSTSASLNMDGTVPSTIYEKNAKAAVGPARKLYQRELFLEDKERCLRQKEIYLLAKENELNEKETYLKNNETYLNSLVEFHAVNSYVESDQEKKD